MDLEIAGSYNRHLRQMIRRVMKIVYEHFDPTNMPTDDIDGWWHSPTLLYQIDSSDTTAPSAIVLNLREGQPDPPVMDIHFAINLNTNRIDDKFSGDQFTVPEDASGTLGDIKEYIKIRLTSLAEKKAELRRKKYVFFRCPRAPHVRIHD